jgi:Domain of Unknown Function (DUF928)
MNKKIEFWLVAAIFTISGSGSIDPYITAAAPTKEVKSVSSGEGSANSISDKLIFSFKGGEKKQQPRLEMTGKRRTRVAGSRGCGADIVALMPRSNLGVTSSANPTFWFYLPQSDLDLQSLTFKVFGFGKAVSAERRLRQRTASAFAEAPPTTTSTDSTEQEIWTQQLPLKSQKVAAGLLSVPYQGQFLTAGTYRWEFSYQQVGCNNPQVLSGYVQKENYSNLGTIRQPRDRLQLYAKNGIWHELLTELITLRQQQPKNSQVVVDFRTLLFESEDVKYLLSSGQDLTENIVVAPLINCCQAITIK